MLDGDKAANQGEKEESDKRLLEFLRTWRPIEMNLNDWGV